MRRPDRAPDPNSALLRAFREMDALSESGTMDVPEMMASIGLDPNEAIWAAEQRGLRAFCLVTGRKDMLDSALDSADPQEGAVVDFSAVIGKLPQHEVALLGFLTATALDAITMGWRGQQLANEPEGDPDGD